MTLTGNPQLGTSRIALADADTIRAAHLLRRAGFTPTRAEIDRAVQRGYEATVDELLHPEDRPDLEIDDLIRRYHVDQNSLMLLESSQGYWMYRIINSQRQLEEKMALFWHGLFATAYGKLNHAKAVVNQTHTFRRHGLGKFADILVELSASNDLPSEEVVIMVTGTQGEPSAVLGRLAQGRHRQLDVRPDDTIVISAHAIPGNEEMVDRTINRLFHRGANVLYHRGAPFHGSGHACQEEMKLMLNLTQPRYFVPVHGELRHLMAHARLALASGLPEKNIRVVENGSVVSINEEGIQIGERVPGGYVFVDGSGVGDVGPAVMRDRETLGKDGFLVVVVNLDADSGELVAEPQILTRGFVYQREADDLIENIRKTARASLADTAASQNGRRRNILQERISKMLYSETRRRPMVFSIINEHQAAASTPSPG